MSGKPSEILSPQLLSGCGDSISLYFHIPFCKRKCDYCHFYVVPDKDPYHNLLMEGLRLEWKRIAPLLNGKRVETVYFGGGTPALLGPESIGELLLLCKAFLVPDAEVTLEANPENITRELMEQFHAAGINRASIGIQSLHDPLLKTLGREHSAEKAKQAVIATYEAGIKNISIDLMYDLPTQTQELWSQTLKEATELPISHLSLYNLTIEPHTVFYKHRNRLQKQLPSEEVSKEMYLAAASHFVANGFEQYEISAFAKKGKLSRHNIGYWSGRPFLGLGPSAFSYWEGKRFRNISHLNRYTQLLKEGVSPIDFEEKLKPDAAARERLVIGLRMLEGVPSALYAQYENEIARLQEQGFLESKNGTVRLTQKGILFYDHLATELI